MQKDVDRLEKCASDNCMMFSKLKCKVLHLGQAQIQAGCTVD